MQTCTPDPCFSSLYLAPATTVCLSVSRRNRDASSRKRGVRLALLTVSGRTKRRWTAVLCVR